MRSPRECLRIRGGGAARERGVRARERARAGGRSREEEGPVCVSGGSGARARWRGDQPAPLRAVVGPRELLGLLRRSFPNRARRFAGEPLRARLGGGLGARPVVGRDGAGCGWRRGRHARRPEQSAPQRAQALGAARAAGGFRRRIPPPREVRAHRGASHPPAAIDTPSARDPAPPRSTPRSRPLGPTQKSHAPSHSWHIISSAHYAPRACFISAPPRTFPRL